MPGSTEAHRPEPDRGPAPESATAPLGLSSPLGLTRFDGRTCTPSCHHYGTEVQAASGGRHVAPPRR